MAPVWPRIPAGEAIESRTVIDGNSRRGLLPQRIDQRPREAQLHPAGIAQSQIAQVAYILEAEIQARLFDETDIDVRSRDICSGRAEQLACRSAMDRVAERPTRHALAEDGAEGDGADLPGDRDLVVVDRGGETVEETRSEHQAELPGDRRLGLQILVPARCPLQSPAAHCTIVPYCAE